MNTIIYIISSIIFVISLISLLFDTSKEYLAYGGVYLAIILSVAMSFALEITPLTLMWQGGAMGLYMAGKLWETDPHLHKGQRSLFWFNLVIAGLMLAAGILLKFL